MGGGFGLECRFVMVSGGAKKWPKVDEQLVLRFLPSRRHRRCQGLEAPEAPRIRLSGMKW